MKAKSGASLQKQIVEQIVAAIAQGHITAETPLPPSRILASQLGVARNTVTLAYQRLKEDGYLLSRERSGYFVNPEFLNQIPVSRPVPEPVENAQTPDWDSRLKISLSEQRNIRKPQDWQHYKYPFIYGQVDHSLFPTNHWRECCRDAVSVGAIRDWANDHVDNDDSVLIDQIHKQILPRRGIWAEPDQILITVGAQHALYMLARLLLSADVTVGIEDPGYVDFRNIASLSGARIRGLPIDENGLILSPDIDECDYLYATPSHQSPTTITMSLQRRYELLERAVSSSFVIIEDDYESEIAFSDNPTPALKSLDCNERVIYVGSLSKTLAPGLRMGYVVGSTRFIAELRQLRRLMIRHPAANNQRSVALFLARGYHDALTRALVGAYRERYAVLKQALNSYMPSATLSESVGGSCVWVQGPAGLNAGLLRKRAAAAGILIEAGDIHFLGAEPPRNYFRLGFSSIPLEKIEPGIRELGRIADQLMNDSAA
ncbi:MocR-like pyridoxine biosynthesis transcription factor PdxR [Woeseia oceani]|uniref:MocR-like pyridoxine biosynthesis transcription factor PdxR n=1 Tax=Woeseia oceani TaxID=1548547 RepID=UPI000A94F28A|nr:PLP-dependent aminotransferase family protein [Woeseia oceani]